MILQNNIDLFYNSFVFITALRNFVLLKLYHIIDDPQRPFLFIAIFVWEMGGVHKKRYVTKRRCQLKRDVPLHRGVGG